ncbi:hypothetical protein [Halocynthiibacter namhaensis]|uniref:hypothetical protein n=1 Tax=Halocynthiibacter namhaensis TaxID=1290553 RepID=UPI0005793445|nr:hypothetical protein [Halocynthiibacter namhaensis]
MKNDLRKLESISQMTLDAALAALRNMRCQQSVHEEEISRLRAARNQITPFTSDISMMVQAQQTQRWKQWCQNEIIRQNSALAALAAKAEELEADARTKFGRREIVRKLQSKLVAEQQLGQRRKALQ